MNRYEDTRFYEDDHEYTEPKLYLEPHEEASQPNNHVPVNETSKEKQDKTNHVINKSWITRLAIFCIILLVASNTITFMATYFSTEKHDTKQVGNTETRLPQQLLIKTDNTGPIDSINTPDIYKYFTPLNFTNISLSGTLHFGVKACHDAFLLLSTATNLKSKTFYEIVIGSYFNERSDIRRQSNRIVEMFTPEVLSCEEYRCFLLSWTRNGTIQVMTANNFLTNLTVIVNATDDRPYPVGGIGIRTGFGITGEWKIDFLLNHDEVCQ